MDAGPRRQRAQRAPAAPDQRRGRTGRSPSTATRPVGWLHRSDRFGEKLATPDTSVGDLIGDVDPIKVAEGRTLGDPETVLRPGPAHQRGIFSVNELPDLAERIQVALLNVLEEQDIQIHAGYRVRLPLDLLLVASANPEDYTNRGRIITPLKDRFGAEVRTHYPLELADEIRLLHQEAQSLARTGQRHGTLGAPLVPEHLAEIIAQFTRLVRDSSHVDQRSGVSARFAIAGLETLTASAVRRAAIAGRPGRSPASSTCPAWSRPAAARSSSPTPGRPGRRARAGDPRAPAAPGDRAGVPRPLRRPGPDRPGALHRRGDRRVRRAGPGRRAARAARQHPEARRAARPARRARGRAVGRAGGGRRGVRPRGPVPDPAASPRTSAACCDLQRGVTGLGGRGGRRSNEGYRYGRWHGGPDPLAPPYDLGNAVDEIGDSVLAGSGVREALRELLRRGTEGRRGLDELRRSVRQLQQARTAGRMDGTLRKSGSCSTRPWRPSDGSCSPIRTTPPGWPRRSWTPCPTTPPAPSGR